MASTEDERVAVERAADRLAERFPHVARQQIDDLVRRQHEHYVDAVVRDFVPVLVEHDVRKQLVTGLEL